MPKRPPAFTAPLHGALCSRTTIAARCNDMLSQRDWIRGPDLSLRPGSYIEDVLVAFAQERIRPVSIVGCPEPGMDWRGQCRNTLVALLDEPLEQASLGKVRIPDRLLERLDNDYAHIQTSEPPLPLGSGPGSNEFRDGVRCALRVLAVVKQMRRLDEANEVLPKLLL